VGRLASEETILQLIKTECVLMLLYGQTTRSLDFAVNRLRMKLFRISDNNVVEV